MLNLKQSIYAVLGLIIIGAGFYGLSFLGSGENNGDNVVCTMEAKICPDGSAVGRTGPKCEFAECPPVVIPSDWQVSEDSNSGLSFRYPKDFGTKYFVAYDWPPQMQVLDEPYQCLNAGKETERAGMTEERMMGDVSYCITRINEGAAGSTYTQYAYARALDSKTVILTFTTRLPQCLNYDDPQRSECQNETDSFNLDLLIHKIFGSIK